MQRIIVYYMPTCLMEMNNSRDIFIFSNDLLFWKTIVLFRIHHIWYYHQIQIVMYWWGKGDLFINSASNELQISIQSSELNLRKFKSNSILYAQTTTLKQFPLYSRVKWNVFYLTKYLYIPWLGIEVVCSHSRQTGRSENKTNGSVLVRPVLVVICQRSAMLNATIAGIEAR